VIQASLEQLLDHRDLTREQARDVMDGVMRGEATPAQIGGFLIALRLKGETADEIAGFAEAMRAHVVPVRPERADLVDTAGTGGDGAHTLNISTLAGLVVAGAGVPVAKHGNRAASSRCGSAEVLEALGVAIDDPARMARAVREVGFGFLYARACHPAMARVAPVRAALGFRTLFNRIGPLTNPMRVRRQLVGVAEPAQLEPMAAALEALGAERVWVVHSEDGLDEISLSAPTRVLIRGGGVREELRIVPGELFPRAERAELVGGDPPENARLARAVLANEPGPKRDAVLLNAAAALCAAERAGSLADGAKLAAQSLESGRARAVLERLVAFTKAAA